VTGQLDQPALPDPADGPESAAARALPGRPAGNPGRPAADSPAGPDRRRVDERTHDSPAEQLRERLQRLPPGHPSSPYDSNGAPRPPVPDYRRPESPLPGELGYGAAKRAPRESRVQGDVQQPSDEQDAAASRRSARPRGIDRTSESGDESTDAWRRSVARLEDRWRKHEEKWPDAERSPADRSDDEPGSWRGDSGHYLNAEENLVSEHARERIGEIEKKTTPTLLDIKEEVPGADLAGLQHRLKGEDRFKEKVSEESRAKPERSIAEIAERMPDALRYTCQIDAHRYVEGYWRGRDLLQKKGNELLFIRNSWDDPEYKGVNTRWLSPQGQVFEVQFHTPESYEAKQLTHKAYERLRSKVTGGDERPLLEAFQREVSAKIPLPPGVRGILDYRKEGY
jgi:hypothetical protein